MSATGAAGGLPFRHRRPAWLRVPPPWGESFDEVRSAMRERRLHTVCEEAHCPNIGQCWRAGTGTFLIMGDTCTRDCRFCAVRTGRPRPPDPAEPNRVADGIRSMGLKHAVITSVTRDDLADGGASVFARCIERTRQLAPDCSIEVLVPDFGGDPDALHLVVGAGPDVVNHNLETVPRLYSKVRPQADYTRSVTLLRRARERDAALITKSGIMVGLGETWDEIERLMGDLVEVGLDILTVGQYLRPTPAHLPIERYYAPEEFELLRERGLGLGLAWVESGPLVRSSFRAERQVAALGGRARDGAGR